TRVLTDRCTVVAIGGFGQDGRLRSRHRCVLLRSKIVLRRLRVLSVLLVVGMEIVDSVVHDVTRIHRFFKTTGNTLHGHRSSIAVSRIVALVYLLKVYIKYIQSISTLVKIIIII